MANRLTEEVWQLELGGVNAYLVNDECVTLIDCGMPWKAVLLREIEETPYSVSEIERVLLTHYDIDHVGGLDLFEGVDVFVGAPDGQFLTGRRRPPVMNRKGLFQRAVGPLVHTGDQSVELVADGDRIGSFTACHTPGHTAGHMAFLSESLSLGLLGDLLSESDGELTPPPWYLCENTETLSQSIRDLADRTPEIETIGVGHGVPFIENGSDRLAKFAR